MAAKKNCSRFTGSEMYLIEPKNIFEEQIKEKEIG